MLSTVIVIIMIGIALLALWGRYQQVYQLNYINGYHFHPAIKSKLKNRYPELDQNDIELVFQALKDYFYICNRAKKRMVSMPSQIVDDAWHEFILFTRSYANFCQKGLGRYLHHTPAEAMTRPTQAQDGIKRAWRLACKKEGINPKAPSRLPLLFTLDKQLAVVDGFNYNLNCLMGNGNEYCAGHIGCGGGCSSCGGDSGGDGSGCCGDSGCGGGCGGD